MLPECIGAHLGNFPKAIQDFLATQAPSAQSLGFLLGESLLDGGTLLEHISADAGLDLV